MKISSGFQTPTATLPAIIMPIIFFRDQFHFVNFDILIIIDLYNNPKVFQSFSIVAIINQFLNIGFLKNYLESIFWNTYIQRIMILKVIIIITIIIRYAII